MRTLFIYVVAAILPILALAAPAYAGKKDTAWAACLWEQVPTTANNWLAMSPSESGFETLPTPSDYALQWRLQAACYDILKPANKKWPPTFNAKSIRAALLAAKPATIRPDSADPTGFRCDLYFENDTELKNRAGFYWGVRAKQVEVVYLRMQYGFKTENGGVARLADGAGIRKCFRVLADGSLTNA
jgi:hypothetical protein